MVPDSPPPKGADVRPEVVVAIDIAVELAIVIELPWRGSYQIIRIRPGQACVKKKGLLLTRIGSALTKALRAPRSKVATWKCIVPLEGAYVIENEDVFMDY